MSSFILIQLLYKTINHFKRTNYKPAYIKSIFVDKNYEENAIF